ncbi:MAG: hypothetical protein ACLRXC_10160 [[Clostridium] leptum]
MTRILLAVMLTNNLRFEESAAVLDVVQTELEKTQPGSAMWGMLCCPGLIMLGREENNFDVWFQGRRSAAEWQQPLEQQAAAGGSRPGLNLQSARAGELKKSLACFTAGVPQ